jgi:Xaa-Pro aminopeptidase
MTEFAGRRKRAGAALLEHEADAIIVSGLPNVRYLTGFTGSNGLVILSPGHALLLTDPRYTIQASQEADCAVRIARGSLYEAAAKVLTRKKWKRVAIERGRMTHGAFLELDEKLGAGVRLRPVSGLVERLRMVKSSSEIDAIRESVQTNSRAFDQAIRSIRPDMTETGLAAELEYRMRQNGAERPAFGCMQAGYASDMTRMLHLGRPGPQTRKLYQAVLEAQLAALAAVRSGTKAGEVDRAARKVLKAHGFDKAFVHSTGHGLGLEIHEAPRLGKKDETVLETGMAITIEPGAYIEGVGGVRIEDTVVVTDSGCEILTPTSKELVVL